MGSDAVQAASGDQRRGRAVRPGPGAIVAMSTIAVLVIAAAIALATTAASGGAGNIAVAGKRLPTSSHYGHPPKWLKIPEAPATTVPTATPRHPQLQAMEGYPVDATLPNGATVQYAAVGPSVPSWVANQAGSGSWHLGETAPSTFELTFKRVTGTVPLSPANFTVITYTGELLHPRITNATGGPVPSRILPGHSLELTLRTSLPEGDGEIRWAPGGKRILVSYFWTLEFD